jgi:serine/threonine-protein kinase
VSRLGDRFVLVRELGSGGVARVYLGRDELLDRPVAVKVLEAEFDDPQIGPLFRREGRTAARLSHPNTVRVYDAGEDHIEGREVSYIVMEYVPGGDLKDLIDRTGPLPEAMLSRLGADVVSGLAHAHERGIIHRDVKPRNILLDGQGNPKLADFGIARAFDTTHETHPGSYLGTAAYSSPELLKGEKVTTKSDVYSFGATLYHAAVGRRPFSGSPIEIANQHMMKVPVPPREHGARIGEGLETLILDCLAKDPDARPDTARLHEKLRERSVALGAQPPGRRTRAGSDTAVPAAPAAGVGRAAGFAKAARVPGVAAFKDRLGGGHSGSEGPPESTISLPTRTFRAGSRPRTLLAVLVAALLLLLLAGLGAWALLGSDGRSAQTSEPGSGGREQAGAAQRRGPEGKPDREAAGAAAQDAEPPERSSDDAVQAEAGLTPPLAQAEQAVFDMYYEMSFARPEASYDYLSERLQNEIGSVEQWAQREDIYTFEYMDFEGYQYPVAEASGNEAEVTFEVRLDHTWGSEVLSGTWVCVNEDGEWKLDRLENAKTVPL